ncbi:MAG: hypothetical protein L3K09_00420 [Thermoplasmata archaeon]|nr:hypothetical protein [Thermoplasmata archaeon]
MLFSWGKCKTIGHPGYSFCDRGLETELTGQAYIFDLTSNTSFSSTTNFSYILDYASNLSACSSSSGCSSSVYPNTGFSLNVSHCGSFSWKVPLLTGMTRGDHYVLKFSMTVTSSTRCSVGNASLSNFTAWTNVQFSAPVGKVLLTSVAET